jgi:hypothetical protein
MCVEGWGTFASVSTICLLDCRIILTFGILVLFFILSIIAEFVDDPKIVDKTLDVCNYTN